MARSSKFKRLGVQRLGVQKLGVQQLGVLGHRVQRQGSSSEFWGTESRGRAADQQAEKVLTSSKTGKVLVFCSADV